MASKTQQAETLKLQLDQLRKEVALDRKRISVTAKDLMTYCEENKAHDGLVTGISDSHNPFQEKKSCSII